MSNQQFSRLKWTQTVLPRKQKNLTTASNTLLLLFIITCQFVPEEDTEAHPRHLNVQDALKEIKSLLIKAFIGQKLPLIWYLSKSPSTTEISR